MPELRKDLVLGHWVLFPGASPPSADPCPYCQVATELEGKRAGLVKTPLAVLDRRSAVDRARRGGDRGSRRLGGVCAPLRARVGEGEDARDRRPSPAYGDVRVLRHRQGGATREGALRGGDRPSRGDRTLRLALAVRGHASAEGP